LRDSLWILAQGARWFADYGITVQRVLTDNGARESTLF
jgi:hypothetical protein